MTRSAVIVSTARTPIGRAYRGAFNNLPSQTLAILRYIDPVVAVLLSALVLREPLGWTGIAGAALILGAALVSELPEKGKKT